MPTEREVLSALIREYVELARDVAALRGLLASLASSPLGVVPENWELFLAEIRERQGPGAGESFLRYAQLLDQSPNVNLETLLEAARKLRSGRLN